MFIEFYIIVFLMLMSIVFGLIGVAGWIIEGEKLRKLKEENRKLIHENCGLRDRLRRISALDNIKVANEYSKEESKDA